MTFIPGDPNRRVVPRWRPARAPSSLDEQASGVTVSPDDSELRGLIRDFRARPTPWLAADLLSASLPLASLPDEAFSAAELLLQTDDEELSLARALSRGVMTIPLVGIEPDDSFEHLKKAKSTARQRVRKLKTRLARDPRNAIRWTDLALAYANLGEVAKARRSIETALALTPSNRFVVRSATRFFVHTNRLGDAIAVLENSGRFQTDPWLLAAHMAVRQVAGKPIQHVNRARDLMADSNNSDFSLSELRGAIATEEVKSGRAKSATTLMRQALQDPTDNAVAQAAWGIDKGFGQLEARALQTPLSFEARTIQHSLNNEWDEAFASAQMWMKDEPFSVRAFDSASYIAACGLMQFDYAAEIAAAGLQVNPNNYVLANNGAFALANAGRLEEASALLEKYRSYPSEDQRWTMTATSGLLSFRKGDPITGRALYDLAWRGLASSNKGSAALCLVMWAREEILANTDNAAAVLERARVAARSRPTSDVSLWLNRLSPKFGREG